ncbi:hypothetical protein CFB3_34870 [Clostridium folliculivorans]|uniref:Uncharacterized protein n=1 Tax=Clostridium folliculivorans TaxID=2886038 RepID=A0A9W5Y511_9CLOT|nr:hypothetical protein CFOLD11_36130 [Clostridium folliculivorans]GKU31380.1 hypothetical protein CFB3_34870 [Clostridium folliculivorans]
MWNLDLFKECTNIFEYVQINYLSLNSIDERRYIFNEFIQQVF